MKTIITGTGKSLPQRLIKNEHFVNHQFYDKNGVKNEKNGVEIVAKLESIAGMKERRYALNEQSTASLIQEAGAKAIAAAGLDPSDIDGIIVGHNSGNFPANSRNFHTIPNLAAHAKHLLNIKNYHCFAYDLLFGCPGWVQGMIQADQAIKAGAANNVLVVGVELLSRMLDDHDLDSMLFGDGCGAAVLSKSSKRTTSGLLSYATFSHSLDDLMSIYMGGSNNAEQAAKDKDTDKIYLKMNGKEVYKYATTWVPKVVKEALDKVGLSVNDVDMFLFHQANEKMLNAIANNLGSLYGVENASFKGKIPTTIQFLGNTSVATVPTLLDYVVRGELNGYKLKKGQVIVMSSVGAGMHCNAIVYKV